MQQLYEYVVIFYDKFIVYIDSWILFMEDQACEDRIFCSCWYDR